MDDLLSTPANGCLSNHWITLHEIGNVAGFIPILVMDVWSTHLFSITSLPSGSSMDAFFSNIDWAVIAERLRVGAGLMPAQRSAGEV